MCIPIPLVIFFVFRLGYQGLVHHLTQCDARNLTGLCHNREEGGGVLFGSGERYQFATNTIALAVVRSEPSVENMWKMVQPDCDARGIQLF